ncbi:hypothetical protein Cs7R123_77830 [Catellatospora sp. TT07R-123]|uniref:hypothetical protein n=1 Tax=Catellatospora sp. TT07R-123 TaxID=2733863 RepID=UPI001B1EDE8B|nr:hypothetical protein [Catellatospora sp. TT07R-123]GHJ50441.1 hypothetical protein Cs7R123_77830 [Catellatospora sp. TT07R-123]
MTMQNAATDLVDLRSRFQTGEKLLIVTDSSQPGRDGLAMPFQDAVVVHAEDGHATVAGEFRSIVLDLDDYRQPLLDSVLRVLRPGGLIALAVTGDSGPELARLVAQRAEGLSWVGVSAVGNRFCVVLAAAPAQGPALLAERILTAAASYEVGTLRTQARLEGSEAALATLIDQRRLSEQALLRHIGQLIAELDDERARTRGMRLLTTLLKTNPPGRAIVAGARPLKKVAKGARKVVNRARRQIGFQ